MFKSAMILLSYISRYVHVRNSKVEGRRPQYNNYSGSPKFNRCFKAITAGVLTIVNVRGVGGRCHGRSVISTVSSGLRPDGET